MPELYWEPGRTCSWMYPVWMDHSSPGKELDTPHVPLTQTSQLDYKELYRLHVLGLGRYTTAPQPCPTHPNLVHSTKALYDSTRFARHRSALPEVNIRELIIHEPSSFLKRGHQLRSIHMRHFTTQLDSYRVPSCKLISGLTNRQQGKRFVLIRSNQLGSTTFSTHPA